ncbi:MAG TPA: hypothetical protein PLF79_09635 [Thauera sp.]|uniref:hypothetical protein n=1 Tax=Thauera sp. TaxID=1905334 RepID=UPI002CF0FD50|nr:hypothetical protein [Thauera sp.]HRP23832.1 hypothetical protein [Thauera sp.]HRP66323.1 hypothetical protein [Thauera sp.]
MDAERKPKMQIFQDEVKLAHTKHWDMDMMSRAELEAYMAAQASPGAPSSAAQRSAAEPSTAEPSADIHRPPAGSAIVSGGQALTAWQRFLRLLSRES